MDEATVRMEASMYAYVAEMNSIIAGVKGMEAANTERESKGCALAYPKQRFIEAQHDLERIAKELRDYI